MMHFISDDTKEPINNDPKHCFYLIIALTFAIVVYYFIY